MQDKNGHRFPVPETCAPHCPVDCKFGGFCVGPGICQCMAAFFGFACQFTKCPEPPPFPHHGSSVGRYLDDIFMCNIYYKKLIGQMMQLIPSNIKFKFL